MRASLSIIILSFNTKLYTKNCLDSLQKALTGKNSNINTEVIVVDNASTDGSLEMLRKYKGIRLVENKKNLGYPKANNQAVKQAKGQHLLLLNSDTIIKKINFNELINYLGRHPKVGGLTVKVNLPSGKIDPASHRGFPTVWNSICYFLKLEKIFGKTPILGKIFGGYHLTYFNLNTEHEIDSPAGAFFLLKKRIFDKVGGFDDKNFFVYGEDLDLSYRIKKAGYKIIYYPVYTIIHLKHTSGLKKKDEVTRQKTKEHFYSAMKTFYKKHYEKTHPKFINKLVYLTIDFKKNF